MVVPLVLVSIVNAAAKFTSSQEGLKKAGKIIAFLLLTTVVSAVFSIIAVRIFCSQRRSSH
jgi:Na+/H+-dicarboxylate symporter